MADKAEAERQTTEEARIALIERYLQAGSPKGKHEPNTAPPGVRSDEVYQYARAAKVAAKRAGGKLGFVAADSAAREALWYEHDNPADTAANPPGKAEPGARIDEETRLCPMCAEAIKVQARKCKHCGSDVDPLE